MCLTGRVRMCVRVCSNSPVRLCVCELISRRSVAWQRWPASGSVMERGTWPVDHRGDVRTLASWLTHKDEITPQA